MPVEGPFSLSRPIVDDKEYHAGISWSPDSQWLGYMTMEYSPGSRLGTSQIDKTNIYTLQTKRLTHFMKGTAIGDNTSWSRDGKIAFELNGGIYGIPDSGGEPRLLVNPASQGKSESFTMTAPTAWSPDGMRIAFQTDDDSENHKTLWIATPASGGLTAILEHQRICCISWPFADKLLLSRVADDGSARIFMFSLTDHKFKQITDGPMDLAPALHPTRPVLFFNHSPTIQFDETASLVARLHLWVTSVPNWLGPLTKEKVPREN